MQMLRAIRVPALKAAAITGLLVLASIALLLLPTGSSDDGSTELSPLGVSWGERLIVLPAVLITFVVVLALVLLASWLRAGTDRQHARQQG